MLIICKSFEILEQFIRAVKGLNNFCNRIFFLNLFAVKMKMNLRFHKYQDCIVRWWFTAIIFVLLIFSTATFCIVQKQYCKLSVAFVVVLSTCSILSKHFLFLRFLSEQMDSFKKGNNFAVKTRRLLFRKQNLSLLRKKVTPYNNYVQKFKCSSQKISSFRSKTITNKNDVKSFHLDRENLKFFE